VPSLPDAGGDPGPGAEALPPGLLDFEPVELRARHDGWTPERQRDFIEALADTLSVAAAAARVGMSENSAFRLRRRAGDSGFGAAWAAAMRQGIVELVAPTVIDRALNGTIVRRYYHGQLIAEERVYSDRLLLALMDRADKYFPMTKEGTKMLGDWEGAMERLGRGEIEDERRVWAEGGAWVTSFPPPDDGFRGWSEGVPGDSNYRRTLTADEQDAMRARTQGAEVARQRFFASGPAQRSGRRPRRSPR
jgi:hypothetical protein